MQLPYFYRTGKKSYMDLVKSTRPGNLVGYWPLNEVAGSIAYDWSGNNNNGVIYGCLLGQKDLLGDGGRSYYLDGVDDYVDVFNSNLATLLSNSSITLMSFCQYTGISNFQPPVVISNVAGTSYFTLYHGTTLGKLVVVGYFKKGTNWNFGGLSSIAGMVAITYDKNNGISIAISDSGVALSVGVISPVRTTTTNGIDNIGIVRLGHGISDYYPGYISHAAIWNCALTTDEINRLYNWRRHV